MRPSPATVALPQIGQMMDGLLMSGLYTAHQRTAFSGGVWMGLGLRHHSIVQPFIAAGCVVAEAGGSDYLGGGFQSRGGCGRHPRTFEFFRMPTRAASATIVEDQL